VLDFRLMRIATFRLSVLAGSLSRIAVGANPFLLPMMMQIGFGLSAAESGMITFAGAAGSLVVRAVAPAMLRRLGFRNALVWVGLIAVAATACSAAFRPDWPHGLIYAVLLIGGFCTSLQFMAYNTVAYADLPRERMSAATSFYTTFQQMTLTLGIATAAAALAASLAVSGHLQPALSDFSVAFLVVSAIALFAPVISLRFDRGAGDEMSGHGERH
jgi:Na+/melibiose symporter-like transporter